MGPQQLSIIELHLNVLQFFIGTRRDPHKFLHLDICVVLLFLLEDVLFNAIQLLECFRRRAVLIDQLITHEGGFDVLDVSRENLDTFVNRFLHGCTLLVDHFLCLLEFVLQVGVLLLQQLQLSRLVT
jgi:hypothetical protein